MAVEIVSSFDDEEDPEPVKIELDGNDLDAVFRDGECNTFGTFNDNGELELLALSPSFAARLERNGFKLKTSKGEKFLKVIG